MKRFIYILFVSFIMITCFTQNVLAAAPQINAKAAILIDAASGRVLYENNAHERLPQASTTKITTALVALENAKLSKKIRLPDNFVNVGESSIYLEPGETHSLEDLMYSLLLKSANDAAEAIAIGVAGSIDNFVGMMNQKVADLGLQNTHYVNPHGLHNEDHYSSAYDLAMLAREALQYQEFREIIKTNKHTLPWPGNEYNRVVYNGNRLLKTYEGADGVKTGYTRQAGSCLVGSATRNGMQLIAVVLNCNGMYDDIGALLDYGFNNYQKKEIIKKGQLVQEISIDNGRPEKIKVLTEKPLSIALKEDEFSQIEKTVYLPQEVKAPIKKGQRMGVMVVRISEDISLSTELISNNDVSKRSIFSYLWYKFISAII